MPIVIEDLSKSYDGGKIFSSINYTFPDKGLYVITGESGIGKTTLLRILASLDKNYDGRIQGAEMKNVSFAFQEYRLFPTLNAIDNVVKLSFDCENTENVKKAEDLLFTLGFKKEELKLFPKQMSGGMQQRISLARAFLKECGILLLDEPTKEINEELCDTVRSMIEAEANKRLVIMVSHNAFDIQRLNATVLKLTKSGLLSDK